VLNEYPNISVLLSGPIDANPSESQSHAVSNLKFFQTNIGHKLKVCQNTKTALLEPHTAHCPTQTSNSENRPARANSLIFAGSYTPEAASRRGTIYQTVCINQTSQSLSAHHYLLLLFSLVLVLITNHYCSYH